LNIPKTPAAAAIHSVSIGWVIAAAAIIIIALVPAFLYLKHSSQNNKKAIAEVTIQEKDTQVPLITDDITEDISDEGTEASPPLPVRNEIESSNKKTVIADSKRNEPAKKTTEKEITPDAGKTEIAAMPTPKTRMLFRGESDGQQNNAVTPPEQENNSGIPPGITFIFENMFAGKLYFAIVIPERIRSIAKNAYAGNPVLYVNIGADVDVHEEAIPGNFAKVYNSYGRQAGIYRSTNNHSEDWKKLSNDDF